MRIIGWGHVGFRAVHSAIDRVILVRQFGKMRVGCFQLADFFRVFGEFFVQFMGGV
jgi:hypothetical protein